MLCIAILQQITIVETTTEEPKTIINLLYIAGTFYDPYSNIMTSNGRSIQKKEIERSSRTHKMYILVIQNENS